MIYLDYQATTPLARTPIAGALIVCIENDAAILDGGLSRGGVEPGRHPARAAPTVDVCSSPAPPLRSGGGSAA